MNYQDATNLVQGAMLKALEESGFAPTADNASFIGTAMVAMGEGMLQLVKEDGE